MAKGAQKLPMKGAKLLKNYLRSAKLINEETIKGKKEIIFIGKISSRKM